MTGEHGGLPDSPGPNARGDDAAVLARDLALMGGSSR